MMEPTTEQAVNLRADLVCKLIATGMNDGLRIIAEVKPIEAYIWDALKAEK
jgi:hypothetical protein